MQKIIISAKVKGAGDAPRSQPKIQYQWHWRRIFVVLLVAVALVYSVVLALESAPEQQQNKPNHEHALVVSTSPILTVEPIAQAKNQNSPIENEVKSDQVNIDEGHQQVVSVLKNDALQEATKIVASKSQLDNQLAQPQLKASLASEKEQSEQEKLEPQGQRQSQPELAQAKSDTDNQPLIPVITLGGAMNTEYVSRALLTKRVEKHEPINLLSQTITLAQFDEDLFFFTDVKNLNEQTIFHRWFYKDQQVAEISLAIYSNQYRTFSSKRILAQHTGPWRVELVNQNNEILAKKEFNIAN